MSNTNTRYPAQVGYDTLRNNSARSWILDSFVHITKSDYKKDMFLESALAGLSLEERANMRVLFTRNMVLLTDSLPTKGSWVAVNIEMVLDGHDDICEFLTL